MAMVEDGGQPRLWVLTKQEEVRSVRVGGGARQIPRWRDDTYFHFTLKVYDPSAARPLWTRHLLTLGDPGPKGYAPSRVIGAGAGGRILGQDGDSVWLLIDDKPMALDASAGTVLADAATLEQRNPSLKGLLPREAKYFGFDQGLVLLSADARRLVIRGPQFPAVAYTPTAAPVPEPDRMANGRERVVPLLPLGDVPARQIVLGGKWLGLFSEKEAADAVDDPFGDHYRYPYTVVDEGALVRRSFWNGRVVEAQRFDDRFQRLADLTPVANAPGYIKGRFLKDPTTGKPLLLSAPDGFLVWHSTRIDLDGRLAITRLDTALNALWTTVLPVSESATANPIRYWLLPGSIAISGEQVRLVDSVTTRDPHLINLQLDGGALQAWNLQKDVAVP